MFLRSYQESIAYGEKFWLPQLIQGKSGGIIMISISVINLKIQLYNIGIISLAMFGLAFQVLADQIYSDKSSFLNALLDSPGFESFENIPLDQEITQSSIDVGRFELMSQSDRLGVRDTPSLAGIDGDQYVIYAQEDNSTLSFVFDRPTKFFGATLIDPLDDINGSLSIETNGGSKFNEFLIGPLANENIAFVGIITDTPFTEILIDHSSPTRDGIAIDGVYFFTDCSLDVDGNGKYDALTDGILAIRYLFDVRGNALVGLDKKHEVAIYGNAVALDCTRCTAPEIEAYLQKLTP